MSIVRFLETHRLNYEIAAEELRNGEKRSHWMWHIFPQIKGLGSSYKAVEYAIKDLAEAREYMADPVLGAHMHELCEILLELDNNNALLIFGGIDSLKLCSSMTLFSIACPEEEIFVKVLDKFYAGKQDDKTLSILKGMGEI